MFFGHNNNNSVVQSNCFFFRDYEHMYPALMTTCVIVNRTCVLSKYEYVKCKLIILVTGDVIQLNLGLLIPYGFF